MQQPSSPPPTYNSTAIAWDQSEWGPSAPPSPDTEDYGWAQESWAEPIDNSLNGNPPPKTGSRYENSEDSLRRSRTQTSPRKSTAATLDDEYSYDDDDDNDNEEFNPEYGTSSQSKSSFHGKRGALPDIALLNPQELDKVLPVVPFSAQASHFNGGVTQAVQRWGASLALTVLLSKAAVLAASSLTWPLWWPWAQAASKNYSVRKQAGYAGLWRTRVLEVEARGRPRPPFAPSRGFGNNRQKDKDDGDEDEEDDDASMDGNAGDMNGDDMQSSRRKKERTKRSSTRPSSSSTASRFSTMRTTRILLGDMDGAQTELILPHDARFDLVAPGQPAELIVLSPSPSFEIFKAVKDVYLPDCGLWLTEYPFLDRTEFLELSLEVEREASMAGRGSKSSDNRNEYEYVEEHDEGDDDSSYSQYDDTGYNRYQEEDDDDDESRLYDNTRPRRW